MLLMSAAAEAQTRAVVLRFTGPAAQQATNVRTAVVKAVCTGEVTCVPQQKFAQKDGGPNLTAMTREDVHVAITGRLSGPAAKRVLTLEAVDPKGTGVFREEVALVKGAVPSDALDRLNAAMAAARKPPEPPPAPEPPAPEPAPAEPPSAEPGPAQPTEPVPSRGVRAEQPLVVVEAGAAFLYRTLGYEGLQTGNLRAYETQPLLIAPFVHVELYPLTLGTSGVVTGLGVEAGYLSSVFLRSTDENDLTYSTQLSRFDVGLRWNFRPVEGTDVMVAPLIGYRGGGFTTGESSAGTRIVGLPDIAYDSLRAGAAAEAGFGPIVLALRAEYLHGLGEGEIATLFPETSKRGWEGSLGLGYRITDRLQARIRLEYTTYGLSFEAPEDAEFRATGADDDQLGASAVLRFEY